MGVGCQEIRSTTKRAGQRPMSDYQDKTSAEKKDLLQGFTVAAERDLLTLSFKSCLVKSNVYCKTLRL